MKYRIVLALVLLSSAATQGGSLTAGGGKDFVQINRTPSGLGPGFTLDYVKHAHNGSAGGLGLDFGLPLGPLQVAPGVRAMYLDAAGKASAGMLGGRASFDISKSVTLFGQAYYAPDAAASGSVKAVTDGSAGVRWNPLPLLMLEAGYRYFQVDRNDTTRSRNLADGPYLGVGLTF